MGRLEQCEFCWRDTCGHKQYCRVTERTRVENVKMRSDCKLYCQGAWLSREPGWSLDVFEHCPTVKVEPGPCLLHTYKEHRVIWLAINLKQTAELLWTPIRITSSSFSRTGGSQKWILKSHTVMWLSRMLSHFAPSVRTVDFLEAGVSPNILPWHCEEHQELFQVRSPWPKATGWVAQGN